MRSRCFAGQDRLPMPRSYWKKALRGVALTTLLTFGGNALLPLPAQAFFFGGVTLKDEKEMGRKFDVMVRSHMPVIEDPEVSQYVDGIVKRLVKAIPPQPFTFTSGTILYNALNAFAVPGGYVYVFSGLIMNLNSESELAGVMAHELAHVTQRHVASRMERAQFVSVGSLLLAVAGIVIGGPGGGAAAAGALGAGQATMLNYSRADETEADHIGLQYLIAAGYPPSGMVGGFKVLRQKSWMSGINVPTYLSTHPDLGDRINGLQARITHMAASVQGRKVDNTRFRRVQTLLWARYGDEQVAMQRFSGRDGLALMGRAIVLARRNNVPEASRVFDSAVAAAPGDALVLREAGAFHYRKGDIVKAEKLLRDAIRRDPHDYMALFFLARLLDESGRASQAAPYYGDVLRHLPEDAEVHEAYARSLGNAGRTADAYRHLTYSAIYGHRKKQAERYFQQAKERAATPAEKKALARLESIYKERKEIWDK